MLDLLNEAMKCQSNFPAFHQQSHSCLAKFESLWRGYCAKYFPDGLMRCLYLFPLVRCVSSFAKPAAHAFLLRLILFCRWVTYYNRGFLPCSH